MEGQSVGILSNFAVPKLMKGVKTRAEDSVLIDDEEKVPFDMIVRVVPLFVILVSL